MFRYITDTPVEGHQGPLLCFLESSQLKKLTETETSDTTMVDVQILWGPFSTCSCNQPVSFTKFFSSKEY
jgi:hypothetical protein